MVIDGRSLSQNDVLDADICVVGAGPAGISLSLELARRGCYVCMLESGSQEPDAQGEDHCGGASVGYWYYPLAETRLRAFGGTSARWWYRQADEAEGWRARPLDPVDFEARAGVRYSGWPFGRDELDSYYERAQRVCRLGPYDYAGASWQTPDDPPLQLDGRLTTEVFQYGFESFVSYFDDIARHERITLVLNATVTEIETTPEGAEVTRLRVSPGPGSSFSATARAYVLAAGGIENPRILLLSKNSQTRGLANGEDLVGRFFMERLTTRAGFIVPESGDLLDRVSFYDQHVVAATSVQGVLRPTDDVIRDENLLSCVLFLIPHDRLLSTPGVLAAATLHRALHRRPRPDRLGAYALKALTGAPDVGRAVYRRLRDVSRHNVLALRIQAEQSPNPDSRVTLDDERDPFGLSRARLDWRIAESDRSSIRRVQEILDEDLRRAGLGRVEDMLGDESPPALFLGSFHHMGTTRMHDNPRCGVVDADCQVHGIPNLFVTGSSVFPTTGSVNPTLTIVALALRLADHLQQTLGARATNVADREVMAK